MRTDKQFLKSITLTALLVTGIATVGIAQDTTTIVNPEAETPVILTTSPTSGEMNVNLSGVIEITFSSEMNENSINGTTLQLHATYPDTLFEEQDEMLDDQIRDRSPLKDSENSWQHATGAVNGTVSYSNKVALFTPDSELKEGTLYTFTVTNGVKNLENIALENDHNWSFTTIGTSDKTYSDNQNSTDGMEKNEYNYSTTDTLFKDNPNKIDLGKAGYFVILAKTSVKNNSASRITGHIGEGSEANSTKKEKDIFNSARLTTFDQVLVLQSNQSDTASPDVTEAIEDMMSAYSDASMQNGDSLTSHKNESFHSTVLTFGVHEWSDSLHIASDVTLSGSADDVWLFKVGENLTVHENTMLILTNGARADNIFWYVEGEVTIGKNAHFEGIILSLNEITLEKGAKLNGRMFSQMSITLDDNTVTEPGSMTGQTTSTNE